MIQDAIIPLNRKYEIKPTPETGAVWFVGYPPVSYGYIDVGSRATVGRLNAEVFATEAECRARVEALGGEWIEADEVPEEPEE